MAPLTKWRFGRQEFYWIIVERVTAVNVNIQFVVFCQGVFVTGLQPNRTAGRSLASQ